MSARRKQGSGGPPRATPPATPLPAAAFPGIAPRDGGRSTRVEVRAQPGARRSGFAGFWNDRLKLAVPAPPSEGRANEELTALVAELFGVRASAVRLVAGATSRAKSFDVALDFAAASARLARLASGAGP